MSRFVRAEKWADGNSHDISHIVQCFASFGHSISRADAKYAWEKHSEGYAAGWLFMDEYDRGDIVAACMPHLRRVTQ